LQERIYEEAKQGKLVNFALRGLARLHEQGEFTIPRDSKSMMQRFRALISPISEFCHLCIVEDRDSEGISIDGL
ncbi:MAG: hypothetical protein ACWGQW_25595, partial [bacterium]